MSSISDGLIIVCGVGRSGTSLLQSMLNANQSICFPPETHFYRKYVAHRRLRNKLEAEGPTRFVERLYGDDYFQRLNISADDLLVPYLTSDRPFSLTALYRDMLNKYCSSHVAVKRSGTAIVGDKDPRLLDYLDILKKDYAEARVIHLVRDPRDVLVSRMRAKWSAGHRWWLHVLLYRAQWENGRRQVQRWHDGTYLEIGYEKLITEPESALRRICEHVRIDYDERMLEFQRSAASLVAKEEMQWKGTTLGPLLTGNTGKWRRELTPFQICFVEAVCAGAMVAHGYQRKESDVCFGSLKRLVIAIGPLLGSAATLLYRLRLLFGR